MKFRDAQMLIERFTGFDQKLTQILFQQEQIMATLAEVRAEITDLQVSVGLITDAVQSAIALIQGIVAQIAGLRQELAEAIAAGADPAALQLIVDDMNNVETTLNAKAGELAAAVVAGTPVP